MKQETLTTLSKRTGYSVSTISRVLSGKAKKYRISDRTCAEVEKEARLCGYHSLSEVQASRRGGTKTIGILVPSVSNPFFADIVGVTVMELKKIGYVAVVMDCMESKEIFSENLSTILSSNVEGIIAIPCGDASRELEQYGTRLPMVLVDRYYPDISLPYVTTNNYQGGLDATNKLISRGHKYIACIQGDPASVPNRDRVSGYTKAMEDAGLGDFCKVVGDGFTIQNGYLETRMLMEGENRPTAIFALSNTIMLGSFKALRESSLRVPEDVALLTFDDNLFMDYMTPSIARISQPVKDMATLAVKILMDRISNGGLCSQIRLMPTFCSGESI